jgi:Galactose-3-O-sulfotransferase
MAMTMPSLILKQGALHVILVLLIIDRFRREVIPTVQLCTSQDTKAKDGQETALSLSFLPYPNTSTIITPSDDYIGPETTYRAWASNSSFPCFEAEDNWRTIYTQRKPTRNGLLYTREMKTGSSTLAGVYLRLAHRKGKLLNPSGGLCKIRIDHSSAQEMEYGSRDKSRSFLISMLREPTKRSISAYFHFRASEQREAPIDVNFQSYFLANQQFSNYYIKDLAMREINFTSSDNDPYLLVQEIIDSFDFIAITERLDESLVVMKMLLGLEVADILYMSAKQGGSFTTGPKSTPCIYLIPSFLSNGMKAFFVSESWKEYVKLDTLLYKAANKSLDNTIDALGRPEFENQLSHFREVLARAHIRCENETIYRCDPAGNYRGSENATCLLWDIGCGYECLNRFYPSAD